MCFIYVVVLFCYPSRKGVRCNIPIIHSLNEFGRYLLYESSVISTRILIFLWLAILIPLGIERDAERCTTVEILGLRVIIYSVIL